MENEKLGYRILKEDTLEGGIRLDLLVEGTKVARATASPDALDDLKATVGVGRKEVAEDLRRTLIDILKSQGQTVTITRVTEEPPNSLHFTGQYTHGLDYAITTGVVSYDVKASTTAPDHVPAVVRNRMRHEVHRRLTSQGSAARALVDLQE